MSPQQHVQHKRAHLVIWSVIMLGFVPVARAADRPPGEKASPSPPAASAGVDPGWSRQSRRASDAASTTSRSTGRAAGRRPTGRPTCARS